MQGDQKATARPAGEGSVERPLLEMDTLLTAESLAAFYRAYLKRQHQRGMNIVMFAGFLLMGIGAGEYLIFRGRQAYIFELGCGLGFVLISLLLDRSITRWMMRQWKGPSRGHYRFLEDRLEAVNGDGVRRISYGEIEDVFVSRGAVYLQVDKEKAYVLTREALDGRLDETLALLEQKTGRRATHVGERCGS